MFPFLIEAFSAPREGGNFNSRGRTVTVRSRSIHPGGAAVSVPEQRFSSTFRWGGSFRPGKDGGLQFTSISCFR